MEQDNINKNRRDAIIVRSAERRHERTAAAARVLGSTKHVRPCAGHFSVCKNCEILGRADFLCQELVV